jgi:phosphoglycolate phosphatase-like HAD superfamily hydrolase
MKAIIFDFDGVIHDTFEFHLRKIKKFTGIELSSKEFKNIHKKNFYFSVPKKYEDVDWDAYRDFVFKEVSMFKIKDKIRKVILELSNKYKLFIVTSGGEKNVSAYLGNNGIIQNFKEVLGMESFKAKTDKFNLIFKKYKLSKKDCIFVTDTLGDIIEANEVGLKTIAVDFGFHCRKTLIKGNPYKIISSFDEILNIVN